MKRPQRRREPALCWSGDNASVGFGAHSGELVQAGTSNQWRLRHDDGTRFEKATASWANGDNDKEYWKATTPDGTQWFFGRGKADSAGTDTKSAWTVPVFGSQSGEPCYNATFANGLCSQAWRWNLDHVVDTNGNAMSYYYVAESNSYGRNNKTAVSSYVRGGYDSM